MCIRIKILYNPDQMLCCCRQLIVFIVYKVQITTAFSVTTATIFFLFTPIAEAQSELLARTSPTIYDVFIALMGGLAGVVALSTKEKGNVIPCVSIATALIPGMFTEGYVLAT